MINFKMEEGIFNFRVAGILFNKNKVLVHRLINDDFYAFPGGRLEMFESTENTIIREMNEELGIEVSINRLLWVSENFFDHKGDKYHEVCFYYLIECKDVNLLNKQDLFYVDEGENQFEFRWIDVKNMYKERVYPTFIRDRIEDLPNTIERIIDSDN
ncbi:NUDIX hydrolase [Clostridium sp. YIM B02551]|uniref:NUDIX hydrolase n=1 Tax=Clostridium sp. YIM B02551 TaxID=2910679 RepID=UPI001EECB78A|nr:NUDIX hydrolase [Clostridium sp. YIM B02551]